MAGGENGALELERIIRSAEAMRRPLQLANLSLEVAPFLQAAFPRRVRVQTYLRNTAVFGGSAIALVAVSLI
ncbi:hypothetical protein ACFXPY_12955 [Streptomyces sp. NPDC059153]|uniref:hypothetical protein n=1 Tax=Streptomyces sp. NPDC059153 TaxID=3346743 RepID=UPI00368AFBA0